MEIGVFPGWLMSCLLVIVVGVPAKLSRRTWRDDCRAQILRDLGRGNVLSVLRKTIEMKQEYSPLSMISMTCYHRITTRCIVVINSRAGERRDILHR